MNIKSVTILVKLIRDITLTHIHITYFYFLDDDGAGLLQTLLLPRG